MEQASALRRAQELQLLASTRMAPVLFHGMSMLPFIQDEDELWAEPVSWQDIQPGDIITYRLGDQFPTCRVLSKQGEHLVLGADNWPWAHFEAWQEDVLAKIVARRRNGRTIRSTDAEWTRGGRLALTRWRARRTVARVRSRAVRLNAKLRDRWVIWRKDYRDLPDAIQINVSSRCNLRCRMCPYLEIHRNPNVEHHMSRETFENLLPALRYIKSIAFVGAGEPLFNKELPYFIQRTHEVNPSARVDLTTNGTLLNKEFSEQFIRLGVRQVTFSFDGMHPETVQAIRRGIPYSRVLQNIRTLTELKKAQDSYWPTIKINYMTGYGTYRELLDFVPLARQLGVREIQLLEMQPATAEDYADNMFHNLERDQGQLLRQAIKTASHAGIQIQLHGVLKNACRHPFTPHVGEDGEVYPCCFLDYDGRQLYSDGKEVQMPGISFGNVNRTTFREIWNSPGYTALRDRTAIGDFPDYCRTCYRVREETADKIHQVLGPR